MTEQQYIRYKAINDEAERLKDFLSFCGKKYRVPFVGPYQINLVKKEKKVKRFFSIQRAARGAINSEELKINEVLQERIIDVIEQYVDELQKKLEEI